MLDGLRGKESIGELCQQESIVQGLYVSDGGAFTAFIGPQKQVVLLANGNGAHGAFCGVVVQLQKTVFPIGVIRTFM